MVAPLIKEDKTYWAGTRSRAINVRYLNSWYSILVGRYSPDGHSACLVPLLLYACCRCELSVFFIVDEHHFSYPFFAAL